MRIMYKFFIFVLSLAFGFAMLGGCSSSPPSAQTAITDTHIVNDSPKADATTREEIEQASAWAQSFFEEPQNRIFNVKSDFLNEREIYIVEISGLMKNGTYPIDTLAICLDTNEQFFYSKDTKKFESFYGYPQFSSQTAPNGRYRAESIGMYRDGSSGLHELKEMRIIDLETGDTIWTESSFLDNHFLWSPESKYVAIQFSGRTWTNSKIVEVDSGMSIDVPQLTEISRLSPGCLSPGETGGIQSVAPKEWISRSSLTFSVQWSTDAGTDVVGSFDFDLLSSSISNIALSEAIPG